MKEKVFKACLHIIEREGWKSFSFAKASEDSGIPLHVFHKYFSAPSEVMVHLFQRIDEKMLKTRVLSEDLSPKDALFDSVMERLDASQPYKSILKSFWEEWIFSPQEAPALACHGYTSMAWMLDTAGLNSRGLLGLLRLQGLMGLYILTLKTWLEDESPDLGKTMAFLDDGLSKLEKAASFLNFS
jgi:ubiquinone biosynthesis protein COQ9